MKSKELKAHNLPKDRRILSSIDAKPYSLIILLFGAGILSMFSLGVHSYNIAFEVIMLIFFFILPKRVMMEFTPSYIIMFNKASRDECTIVYYEEIVSWSYNYGINYDELEIKLEDGSTEKIEGFSRIVFENNMNMYLSQKKLKKK